MPITSRHRALPESLLGGLDHSQFLRQHWQKRHLLVRQAMPGFSGPLSQRELFTLASRDDLQSRLVIRVGNQWTLDQGPFKPKFLRCLPPRDWTLLVQGVNLILPSAESLLRSFSFIPYARLDDVMVSFAVPGGGVGPHFDSYDVFLLQGFGHRRWRVSTQKDLTLRRQLPVKILSRFRAEHEWTLGPGDMLYLPPGYAHDGTATDNCMTYSIGFKSDGANELAAAWLDHMRDELPEGSRYTDPHLKPTATPARLTAAMVQNCQQLVRSVLPRLVTDRGRFTRFLGIYLTEPKPHVYFNPPKPPLAYSRFALRAVASGFALDPRTQMLYGAETIFINGTAQPVRPEVLGELCSLANERRLLGAEYPAGLLRIAYAWYVAGYLHLLTKNRSQKAT